MQRFSRYTVMKVLDLLHKVIEYHAQVEEFALLFELEGALPQEGVIRLKLARLIRYIIENPNKKGPFGGELTYEIIEYAINEAHKRYLNESEEYRNLENSLKRDGFIIEDNKLRTAMPETVQLSEKQNELDILLERFSFSTEKGHLEQAISAHTRGDWASANAQLRTFFEGLFNSIAERLSSKKEDLPQPGHERRRWLSNLNPPFLQPDLNEWRQDNKGFVEGLFKRLHPEGSHPGLSDEEDSTFRLHFVILTALHYLRRLDRRT